jgi:hypothetical protein
MVASVVPTSRPDWRCSSSRHFRENHESRPDVADRSPRVYSTGCSTFVDDHMVYAVLLGALAIVGAGRYLGPDRGWEDTALVKRFPVLK